MLYNQRLAHLLCAWCAFTTVGYAGDGDAICDELQSLRPMAEQNFEDRDALKGLLGADKCSTALSMAGVTSLHCAWQFAYRGQAANDFFDRFNADLRACFEDAKARVAEAGVNHPDSYDQMFYDVDGMQVSVSLKDKGALQETYVFVGVQGSARK